LCKLCNAATLRQAWRWRFFVIRGTQLAYFKRSKRNAKPCGVIDLRNAFTAATLARRGRNLTFQVEAQRYKPLFLRAATPVRHWGYVRFPLFNSRTSICCNFRVSSIAARIRHTETKRDVAHTAVKGGGRVAEYSAALVGSQFWVACVSSNSGRIGRV
jgi:hypothetical protein